MTNPRYKATVLYKDFAEKLLAEYGHKPGEVTWPDRLLEVRWNLNEQSRLVGFAALTWDRDRVVAVVELADRPTQDIVEHAPVYLELMAMTNDAGGFKIKWFGLSAVPPRDPRETPLERIQEPKAEGLTPGDHTVLVMPTGVSQETIDRIKAQFQASISGVAGAVPVEVVPVPEAGPVDDNS